MLWVINSGIEEWEKALPVESQDLIHDNRLGQQPKPSDKVPGLKAYPFVSTFQADYPPVRPPPFGFQLPRGPGGVFGLGAPVSRFVGATHVWWGHNQSAARRPYDQPRPQTPAPLDPGPQELVTLLSQQATWQMLKAKRDVEEMMG